MERIKSQKASLEDVVVSYEVLNKDAIQFNMSSDTLAKARAGLIELGHADAFLFHRHIDSNDWGVGFTCQVVKDGKKCFTINWGSSKSLVSHAVWDEIHLFYPLLYKITGGPHFYKLSHAGARAYDEALFYSQLVADAREEG